MADALVAARPDRYTANPLKKTREGKIFVDYLRKGAAAQPSSTTRPGQKRGARRLPLRWDEPKGLKAAAPYTVKTLPARLKRAEARPVGGVLRDPPIDYGESTQALDFSEFS